MKTSIIIPALNEAKYIQKTLASVESQAGSLEILVVDGGSTDRTIELASERATVISSPAGRAVQMNAGAQSATGDILLFLHADTLLPNDAIVNISRVISESQFEAGAFRLRFDLDRPLLRFYSWCTAFNRPSICFGDRGLFVRRDVFYELGGFPPIPIFEDLEMVKRLYKRGHFLFMSDHVTTAARRFVAFGVLRQQVRNGYLWLRYLSGTDPRRLASLYSYANTPEPHREARSL